MPLQSIFTDENSLYDLTHLLWQFNSALLLRLRNLSFSKKYHLDGWALFHWQFDLILLLCLCNLSPLMKKLPMGSMVDAFTLATQFDILAVSSQSLFLKKKIFHCWLELFLLQLNSILLLCLWLCLYDLSFLEKYQLYRLALFQCAIWFDIVGVSLHFQFLSNVDLWKCSKIQGVWQEASFVEKALVFQLHGDAQLGFKGPVAIPGSCSGAFSIEKAKLM